MYHGFCRNRESSLTDNAHVLVHDFEEQLNYLVDQYNPISLSCFVDACQGKASLPPRSVVLTFDDGYASNHALAYPLLERYEVPATIYLATEFVIENRLLWPDKVALAIQQSEVSNINERLFNLFRIDAVSSETNRLKMIPLIKNRLKHQSDNDRRMLIQQTMDALEITDETSLEIPSTMQSLTPGDIQKMANTRWIEFGSHTQTHPILSQCNDDQIELEITTSVREIEALTGRRCRHFAYPNGQRQDFDQRAIDSLKKNGIETAVSTIEGENHAHEDMYQLKRIGVYGGLSLDQFKKNLQPGRRHLVALKNRITGIHR